MIAREQARLQALFGRLVALSLSAVPAACSTSNGAAGAPSSTPDGSTSSTGTDAASDSSSGSVPGADTGTGGGDDAGSVDATVTPSPDGGGGDDAGSLDAASCAPEFLDGADDGSGCDLYWGLACGIPPDAATEGCFLSLPECDVICQKNVACRVFQCDNDAGIIPPGPISIECGTFKIGCGSVGRRPEGLEDANPARAADAVGDWLARTAWLEAASVGSFRRLAAELAARGAPRALVRAAERSARDEVRHARVTSRLARRRGAAPARVVVGARPRERSLEAIALENAVEGCVREAFGALVATHQASAARDPAIRRAMKTIAADETRHAALAASVAKWTGARLDAAARARIDAAVKGALGALRCEVAATPAFPADDLGLPRGDAGVALLDAFADALFDQGRA